MIPTYQAVHANSEEFIKNLPNESVDVICIDPPYLYLKRQKLERPFDEKAFFEQCKRVLTENGMLITFGRGVSFYRWNCLLHDLGFKFKEEVVWYKKRQTSPAAPLARVHETTSIWAKGKGKIMKSYVPYLEKRSIDIEKIESDIKRICSCLKNEKDLKCIQDFVELNRGKTDIEDCTRVYTDAIKAVKYQATLGGRLHKETSRGASALKSMQFGFREESCIRLQEQDEQDVIIDVGNPRSAVHPTQKPVRLLERLLKLCLPKEKGAQAVVADFFAGSFSCAEACHNLGVSFIGCEIDEEYFNLGQARVKALGNTAEKV